MSYLPMTDYESVSVEAKREYDDQIAKNGRVTHMKRTLLHNVRAYHAYMEWYTLRDELLPFVGERGVALFSYAISTSNECLICSTFFRKILVDSGEDADNPTLSETEQLLMDLGHAIGLNPGKVEEGIYRRLKERFNTEQIVILIAFAGIMVATNLFNTVAKVDLDEILYGYVAKNG